MVGRQCTHSVVQRREAGMARLVRVLPTVHTSGGVNWCTHRCGAVRCGALTGAVRCGAVHSSGGVSAHTSPSRAVPGRAGPCRAMPSGCSNSPRAAPMWPLQCSLCSETTQHAMQRATVPTHTIHDATCAKHAACNAT
jgi:hypothetical protein